MGNFAGSILSIGILYNISNQKRRALDFLLRSDGYQLASSLTGLLAKIMGLVDEALDFSTADRSTGHIGLFFRSILFHTYTWRHNLK